MFEIAHVQKDSIGSSGVFDLKTATVTESNNLSSHRMSPINCNAQN